MRKIASLAIAIVAYAAAQTPSPQFEVASIKPSPPGTMRIVRPRGGPGTPDPGLFVCEYCITSDLLPTAFGISPFQVSFPDSMESPRFSISAKIPPGTTKEQFHLMLQNLLVDRFKMTYHRDRKQMQTYQLVVAKNGPKFKPSVEAPAPDADGAPVQPNAKRSTSYSGNTVNMHIPEETMSALATNVSSQLNLPVTDATGLKGKYDITLSWAPEDMPDSPGPNIFQALQDQLGLKLESKKAMVDIVVIDHIEKTPTEN